MFFLDNVMQNFSSLFHRIICVCFSYFSFQGVQIPRLGTFTFTRQKLDMGSNKFILIQRPVFILAEKLVQIHGLKQNKVYSPGNYNPQDFCRNLLRIKMIRLNWIVLLLNFLFKRLIFHMVSLAKGGAGIGK